MQSFVKSLDEYFSFDVVSLLTADLSKRLVTVQSFEELVTVH